MDAILFLAFIAACMANSKIDFPKLHEKKIHTLTP